jgi:hypothetical protein
MRKITFFIEKKVWLGVLKEENLFYSYSCTQLAWELGQMITMGLHGMHQKLGY